MAHQYHMNHLNHHNDVIFELPEEEYDNIPDTYDNYHNHYGERSGRNDGGNPVSTTITTTTKTSPTATTIKNKNDTLRSSSNPKTTTTVEKKNNINMIDDMKDNNNNNIIILSSTSKALSSSPSKEKCKTSTMVTKQKQQRRMSNDPLNDMIKKDYETTGQWGNHVSKKEMIIMIGIIIMIVFISITAVLLYVLVFQTNTTTNNSNNNSTTTSNGTSSSFANNATTNTAGTTVNTSMNNNSSGSNSDHKSSSSSLYGMDIQDDKQNTKLIFESNEDMYQAILLMIQNSNIMTKEIALSLLPTSVYDIPKSLIYDDLSILGGINNPSINNSWIWTVSYLLYGDIRPKYITELKQRFVLTFLFIETIGTNWYVWTNWLSPLHICQWYGITCQTKMINDVIQYVYETSSTDMDISNIPSNIMNHWNITTTDTTIIKEDMIIELDLANNNLNGTLSTIPFDLLYNSIESIFLLNNTLYGTIPGITFGSLIHLSFLYLQNNILTGTIPETLRPMNSTSLGTLFVQGNQFNGTWPESFCPAISTECGGGDNDETVVITNANECIIGLKEFGLNCIKTPCPENCCTNFNCFN